MKENRRCSQHPKLYVRERILRINHPASKSYLLKILLAATKCLQFNEGKINVWASLCNTTCSVPTPKPSTTLRKSGGAASMPRWQTRPSVGVLCVDKDCLEFQKMQSRLWRLLVCFANKQINECPFSKWNVVDWKRTSQAQNHSCVQIFIKTGI